MADIEQLITTVNRSLAIVDDKGQMSRRFEDFIGQVSASGMILGDGSPEGVIKAKQGREYMDRLGTAGSIKYVKRDSDIAGDTSLGWILI